MTLKTVQLQLDILEKKAQTLRLRLVSQKIAIPTKKNVWESTAGVMTGPKGQRFLIGRPTSAKKENGRS